MRVLKQNDYVGDSICIEKKYARDDEPIHKHEFIEIVYISEGKGTQCIDGTVYKVQKGDVVFINYNQTHLFSGDGKMAYYNCLLCPEFMSKTLINTENIYDVFALSAFDEFDTDTNATRQIAHFRGRELLEIENIINNMLTEYKAKRVGYKSVLQGYMQVFFAKIIRKIQESNQNDVAGYMHNITPDILKYIDDNLSEKLNLSDLAKRCFYNPYYFSRMFKQCYGISLGAYICEKRMNKAMELLKNTANSVGDICDMVGYNDRAQFYKAFKKHTGMTPREYRDRQQD